MSTGTAFTPRSLTASEYVQELFGPGDNAAILVRNRSTGHTVQTIAKAEAIASAGFQTWLANQSARGYDVFIGRNPIKDYAYNRTKANIKDIRQSISTSTERVTKLSRRFEIQSKSLHRTLSSTPLRASTRSCGK